MNILIPPDIDKELSEAAVRWPWWLFAAEYAVSDVERAPVEIGYLNTVLLLEDNK